LERCLKDYLPLVVLGITLLVGGCARSDSSHSPSPTPPTPAVLAGQLTTWEDGAEAVGRQVTLCRIEGDPDLEPFDCVLSETGVTTDGRGRFELPNVTPGAYVLVADSGLSGFDEALETWAGQTLTVGDWPWLRRELISPPVEGGINSYLPPPLQALGVDRAAYAVQTMLVGDSPFQVVHQVRVDEDGAAVVEPIVVEAAGGANTFLQFQVAAPPPVDYEAVRAEVGGLTREEVSLFDRDLVARWERFLGGDDAAYSDTDVRLIEAERGGLVHPINGAYFTRLDEYDGQLVKRIGYAITDVQTGEKQVIGWFDDSNGDVVEAATGYRLNVRDDPGVWIEDGAEGERYYHYGFSYYRRWERILPDPVIDLLEDFYSEGADYVRLYQSDYEAKALSYGGDLRLIDWADNPAALVSAYLPDADYPPFVTLPDSGTVDIRRERFLEAIVEGAVFVDEESVDRYVGSESALNGAYVAEPARQQVIDALLTPYRSGHLFSDLEAAIILDVAYDEEGPLRIVISPRLQQGFSVPRDGRMVVYVSANELSDVIMGYPGVLNSRWGHEMAHVVDFRSPQYTFQSAGGRICEPIKYIIEYMWWVQRYPGDAPEWDWVPLNSGLTLSRLLEGRFHNSGC
jgi:hypothetical protein